MQIHFTLNAAEFNYPLAGSCSKRSPERVVRFFFAFAGDHRLSSTESYRSTESEPVVCGGACSRVRARRVLASAARIGPALMDALSATKADLQPELRRRSKIAARAEKFFLSKLAKPLLIGRREKTFTF